MESAFLKIINAKVLTPSGLLPNGQIIISDGKIVEITGQNREIPHAEIIDAKSLEAQISAAIGDYMQTVTDSYTEAVAQATVSYTHLTLPTT